MKKTLKKAAVLLVASFVFTGGTLSAEALQYSSNVYGQRSWTAGTKGQVINIRDTKNDKRFVSVQYKYKGGTQQGSLVNKSGANTTVTRNVGTRITAIRPCISNTARPMSCGGWIY